MQYQELHPIDRKEALAMLEAGDVRSVSRAILRLALHDPDGHRVTEQALNLLNSPEAGIRVVAATALGHTARIHGHVDERVLPALRRMLTDPETSGRAQDALDDIEMFARR
ncbi:hypothetical protein [Nocardia carnea]|uniref:hypothetical protein n=1 Tax=Nocardia carnea TaxID=37328 RepID=UPI002458EE28|nr:hypothetical protein [Nocardia carnea]